MIRKLMILKSKLLVGVLIFLCAHPVVQAQEQAQEQATTTYLVVPVPDVWFNQVDGFRLGMRIKGQEPMSFNEGSHQLSMGVWVATKWPELPISYHITLTEPLPAWSSFGNEASVTALSTVREGYAAHGLLTQKRWQQGFNERQFTQWQTTFLASNRFDLEYPLYPQAWQEGWQYTAASTIQSHREWEGWGQFSHKLFMMLGISQPQPNKTFTQVEFTQEGYHRWTPQLGLAHRVFVGLGSASLPLQQRYHPGSGKAISELESGFTRSAGLIPPSMLRKGRFHLASGPHLRGYARRTAADSLDTNTEFNRILATNLELKFPNPLSRLIQKLPMIGSVLNSRMYLFTDIGKPLQKNTELLSDAGVGFALGLTLPDMTGQTNALTFRMELPAWVSHPSGMEPNWKLRPVFGLNSVFTW